MELGVIVIVWLVGGRDKEEGGAVESWPFRPVCYHHILSCSDQGLISEKQNILS